MGDFIGFSKFTRSKLDIQNGLLYWLYTSQNFYFRITITVFFISDLDHVCFGFYGLIRALISGSLAINVAFPFN